MTYKAKLELVINALYFNLSDPVTFISSPHNAKDQGQFSGSFFAAKEITNYM